jgi:kynurenine formamidase
MAKKQGDKQEPYTREMHEAYRKKVEAEERKEAAARQERIDKLNARRQWLKANGDEDVFERDWPDIYKDILEERRKEQVRTAAAADTQAREAQRRSRVSQI